MGSKAEMSCFPGDEDIPVATVVKFSEGDRCNRSPGDQSLSIITSIESCLSAATDGFHALRDLVPGADMLISKAIVLLHKTQAALDGVGDIRTSKVVP